MPLQSVIHQFAEAAKFFPERNALYNGNRYYSYRELSALAQGIRNGLVESGFAGESCIGLLAGDDVCTYGSILAVLANGSACVPLSSNDPWQRNAQIIADADVSVVLVSGELEAAGRIESALPEDIEVMRTRARDSDSRASTGLDVAAIDPDGLAYLFYNPSSAPPGGTPICHRHLNSFMQAMLDPAQATFAKDDRFLQMFELTVDLSTAALFTPLCVGACCYSVPEQGARHSNAARLLEEQALTVALMAPSTLASLEPSFGEIELPALRLSQLCGTLPRHVIDGWSRCAPNARVEDVSEILEATIRTAVPRQLDT